MSWKTRVLYATAGVCIPTAVLCGALWLATIGEHVVPATVTDDVSLPAITVHGVRLHAEAKGPQAAPVVIVLHGGPGDDYLALLDLGALSDDYRIVFYDQRGAGLSERVDVEQLTLEAYLTELDGVIDQFASEPVHLVGHSWGAMLASAYLGRHPDRVASATLIEPGFLTPEASRVFLEEVGTPDLSFGLLRHAVWTGFEAMHVSGPDNHARMDHFMLRFAMEAPSEGHPLGGYFCDGDLSTASLDHWRFGATASISIQQMISPDGSVQLGLDQDVDAYPGPVLFVTGACNVLIGTAHQRAHHLDLFQNATLVEIPNAGHSLIGEKPEETVALLRDFLDDATSD
ncbi:MAG: alpha/beta hydrolase [Proteobacteria bacterium]|nr:alpha/beta hydrolase [Pseudomonadota bacterium]